MSGEILISIDAGGTAVKVVAFDLMGAEIAAETADVPTDHHPDGRVERDVEAFWAGTTSALRRLTARCAGQSILAVGCTGFGNGVFLLGADGRGTRPGIVSVDHRAQPLVDELAASGQATAISAHTGHRLWGGQTLMQLAFLARTEPDVMARSRWALACKDVIRFRLTGAALTDPTEASGGGLMDVAAGTYAHSVFDQLGLAPHAHLLPPIVASAGLAGRVSSQAAAETGLPEGTPVAGSMMDVAASSLGAGAVDAAVLTMIAGTWSINSLESGPPKGPQTPILNMLYRGDDRRLIAEGSPCSAANLGWFLDHAMGGRVTMAEANSLVANSPVQTRRCQFLPYVFGPDPRRGTFVDLGARDDLGTMLRAIFEGVVFQARRHAEDAVAVAGQPFPQTIRLAGGASKSPVWAQIFADICQRKVEVVRAAEVGALGAAICAAVACGAYTDLAEAAAQMTGVARSHSPDAALGPFYEKRFHSFCRLDHGLAALLEEERP
jgi:L-xylulokinase